MSAPREMFQCLCGHMAYPLPGRGYGCWCNNPRRAASYYAAKDPDARAAIFRGDHVDRGGPLDRKKIDHPNVNQQDTDVRARYEAEQKARQDRENQLMERFRPHFEERAFSSYFVNSIRHVPGAQFGLQTDPEMNLDLRQLCDRGPIVAGDPKAPYLRPEIDAMWHAWKMFILFFIIGGNRVKGYCTICAPGTDSPGFASECVLGAGLINDDGGLPWKCDGKCKLSLELGDLVDHFRAKPLR